MKKVLLATLALLPLALCACGNASNGVEGKTFVFSSCTKDAIKTGTSESFYTEDNPAGATKDAVVESAVKALESHGTSDKTGEISFGSATYSNMTYKGAEAKVGAYNTTTLSEYSETRECYWVALSNDYTSVHFVELAKGSYSELVDYTFSMGGKSSAGSENGVSQSVSYKTYAADTAVNYNKNAKTLSIALDVTYEATVNSNTTTSVMSYTLSFTEKA